MNGRIWYVNVWIWYANGNLGAPKTGLTEETENEFMGDFFTLRDQRDLRNVNRTNK
ncbi:hypothetical protein CLV93_10537 [Prolixibacter denitrificans]|uniref:Uncharacterized protein n=1 Tax=Prolixibacter denitrificans TaxID=1541063 RepID=A0A2P8CCG0_9BACT|nr:hypothetical protein CLV93_10537 [Prolixibacter denitrificans]